MKRLLLIVLLATGCTTAPAERPKGTVEPTPDAFQLIAAETDCNELAEFMTLIEGWTYYDEDADKYLEAAEDRMVEIGCGR